jgi:hypothetical protein
MLYIKLGVFYFILFIDLILSSFIEGTMSTNTAANEAGDQTILYFSII